MSRFRTLVRVVSEPKDDSFYIIVPGWNYLTHVKVMMSDLSNELISHVRKGNYFHVMMNLGADKAKDLAIDSWEIR